VTVPDQPGGHRAADRTTAKYHIAHGAQRYSVVVA
jgi:hypothetical protein